VKHRLCLPELTERGALEPGQTVRLSSEHAHYLGRVLRLKSGAQVGLFDGAGNEWPAELNDLSNRAATAVICGATEPEPAPVPLVLVASWLKGNAMDAVVQKSVELGATAVWLLDATRSNYTADTKRRANKLAHLQRVARAAAEQCDTRWLPSVTEVGDLAALLRMHRPGRTLFLDPGGSPLTTTAPEPLTLVIGPEGGWSDAERDAAGELEGLEVTGLGPLTLRAETAPLAVLAAIRQCWGWQR
jgi:16S rRNA (uracil1498-N3)-methyltransferase